MRLKGVQHIIGMGAIIKIYWSFTPADYFEQGFECEECYGALSIARGTAEAIVDNALFESNPAIVKTIHESLRLRFLAVQSITHAEFNLSDPSYIRIHLDGRTDHFVNAEAGKFIMRGGSVDFQVVDKHGNVVSDTRRDRIDSKLNMASLASKHGPRDVTLAMMLQSYHGAVKDPKNELVYLFEVREALCKRFDEEREVRNILKIDKKDWSDFGRLCNDEPLRQGRHRGKMASKGLRDATQEELTEARRIARNLIHKYLEYLEDNHPSE